MNPRAFAEFCRRLEIQLQPAHRSPRGASRFEPELSYGRHLGPPPPHARAAAVVLLLYLQDEEIRLPLIVRPQHLSDHPNQVSLPGGGRQANETSCDCALRELQEELGPGTASCRVLGALSPIYVWASNFFVEPFVAALPERPDFQIDPAEVAELLKVPVSHLRDVRHRGEHDIQRSYTFRAPHIEFGGHRIWGATSIILDEFLHAVEDLS
jgi:8-oxo-dGTP pyrophosphatase MutT (NUDIX family)